jgi:hypothetical protein
MNLKTIIAKVVSWFKGEASTVEQRIVLTADGWKIAAEGEFRSMTDFLEKDLSMSTPAAAAPAAVTAPNQVNTAVQIALALKAIDASLSVDAVQAATNAALAALYPAA